MLPLVAGLFILVEAVAQTGLIERLAQALASLSAQTPVTASWVGGVGVAIASNLMNNLPTGLIAGSMGSLMALPQQTTAALLIGVDLGPNLSITGSLATLLWLVAIRREGEHVSAWRFSVPGCAGDATCVGRRAAGLVGMTGPASGQHC